MGENKGKQAKGKKYKQKKRKLNRKSVQKKKKRKWPHRDSNPHLDHLLGEKQAPRPLGHAAAE